MDIIACYGVAITPKDGGFYAFAVNYLKTDTTIRASGEGDTEETALLACHRDLAAKGAFKP